MSNMICENCGCGCLILPYNCLYNRQRRLQDLDIERYPEILDAVNSFVLIGENNSSLLGHDCFNALCKNVKQAQEQANEYNENNVSSNDPQSEFWYYLDSKWSDLLNNTYFQQMYAAYAMYYYYYLGIASSKTGKVGDVQRELRGTQVNDGAGGKNITLDISDRKGQRMLHAAKMYANLFKTNFWSRRRKQYGCNSGDCDTTSHSHCNCKRSVCESCNPYRETPKLKKPRATWL